FRDAHMVLAVVAFIGAYVVIVGLSLPGATVATLTGGFLFGTFPGVLYNVTGATLGAILIFLAARAGLGARLAARMEASEGAAKRFKAAIDANQWSALFLLRLVPAVPFFVANVLPALFDVRLSRFAITTALGIVPGALVYTSVGAGLDFLAGAQVRAPAWVRRLALEWLWRMALDPRRLAARYAACAAILPGQALAALRQRRRG
ncbi:MAG: VTT domain-containing protein, partial [Rhodobacterales bacterium]|nr:VTT domain-containing protein [Rhodobacterales bacterium]